MDTEDWRIVLYRKVWSQSCRIEGQVEWELEDWMIAQKFYEAQRIQYQGNISCLQLGLTDGKEMVILAEINYNKVLV